MSAGFFSSLPSLVLPPAQRGPGPCPGNFVRCEISIDNYDCNFGLLGRYYNSRGRFHPEKTVVTSVFSNLPRALELHTVHWYNTVQNMMRISLFVCNWVIDVGCSLIRNWCPCFFVDRRAKPSFPLFTCKLSTNIMGWALCLPFVVLYQLCSGRHEGAGRQRCEREAIYGIQSQTQIVYLDIHLKASREYRLSAMAQEDVQKSPRTVQWLQHSAFSAPSLGATSSSLSTHSHLRA